MPKKSFVVYSLIILATIGIILIFSGIYRYTHKGMTDSEKPTEPDIVVEPEMIDDGLGDDIVDNNQSVIEDENVSDNIYRDNGNEANDNADKSTYVEIDPEVAFANNDVSADWESGEIQIGRSSYYIGETINDWVNRGLYLLDNTSGYKSCMVLSLDGQTPICRVYIRDSGTVDIKESIITSAWFGMLWNSDVRESVARNAIENPPSVKSAGGVSVGTSYDDLVSNLGDPAELEETSVKTIVTAHYYGDLYSYFIDIDRNTSKVCGFAYGIGKEVQ